MASSSQSETPFSSQAFAAGPTSQTFTQPTQIPAVNIGTQLLPAGDWAAYIKQLPWTSAVKATHLKSDLLTKLVALPSRNEPSIRVTWTPTSMSDKIGSRIANVEAAMIQVVGTEAPAPCIRCNKGAGPFSHCVVAPGFTECGNCHWGGKSHLCSFGPRDAPTPKTHRRTYSEEKRTEWRNKRKALEEEMGELKQHPPTGHISLSKLQLAPLCRSYTAHSRT